ncbi:Carboxypeptidase [Rhynchospora pubera]|uniref:Carboxypeptidase n=1 Tax=Rhynchospora pubera TaxID=906938 RepID=A0AAV8BRK4_9POAL|nr:Carboxypeptidase [Rhynchospora pubera]
MKAIGISLLLISINTFALFGTNEALNEAQMLHKIIWSPRQAESANPMIFSPLAADTDANEIDSEPLSPEEQHKLRKADQITKLPGQPEGVNFAQYSGYIPVNKKEGRELFYYLVESPQNASSKPLVLWLNGGPGCSSLGYGAFEEVGPFRVNDDSKTLQINKYAWNKLANVLFVESPAGVGYSKAIDGQINGDELTALESHVFLVSWLDRFPEYKNRPFFIAGESYAGHYIPQLADLILNKNAMKKATFINLRGVAIGNPYIDKIDNRRSQDEYYWRREFITDECYQAIKKDCEVYYQTDNFTTACEAARNRSNLGSFDAYNIYAPLCISSNGTVIKKTDETEMGIDPCIDSFVEDYLNTKEVKEAFHAQQNITWWSCSNVNYPYEPDTTVPTIKKLITKGLRVMLYSGDIDSVVPFTTTKKSVKAMQLPVKKPWRPWNCDGQVGGFVEEYENLTLATVRGAGHQVPSNQPMRAYYMFSNFLQGKPLPKSPFVPRYD